MAETLVTSGPVGPAASVYIIDGSSFLYRAYYSMRPLHTPTGLPVQAVYSFCRMIKHLIDQWDPHYMVLAWDSRGKTSRHDLYPAYKATRQAAPSDLFAQKELIMKFADIIGIRQCIQDGIEADDLMYSIAIDLVQDLSDVIIVSSDKDMAQILGDHVTIFDPFKNQFFDKKIYEATIGFSIDKLPFYYALVGDSSDNIPGVKGIGKKGALDIVTRYQTLEQLYAHVSDVKPVRLQQLLSTNRENAFLSEQLFKLRYYPLHIGKDATAFDKNSWNKAQPFFQELNFKSLIEQSAASVGNTDQHTISSIQPEQSFDEKLRQYNFSTVTCLDVLKNLCTQIEKVGFFAIDTETDGLSALQAQCVGISICYQAGSAYYIPCGHVTGQEQLTREQIVSLLGPIMRNPTLKKYMHNAKFDQLVLRGMGMEVVGLAFDSYIAARLLLKEWQRAGLKALSEFYLNESMLSFEQVMDYCKVKNFAQVPLDVATRYAAADAHQTYRLTRLLQEELEKEPIIKKLYDNVEFPLINVLADVEAEGITLDTDYLKSLGQTVQGSLEAVESTIKHMVNQPTINLNSPKQVQELLFVQLGLPAQKKSAKGTAYSTDQEVLASLAHLHVIPGLIMQYRELAKLKSTYIDALPDYVNPRTGRIHTSFSQVSTATGRLASSDPNLQNVPTDSTGYGIAIRGAFKPKQGHCFVAADYSQIELRVLAHMSQDFNLKEAFAAGVDIHSQTAARIFNMPVEQVQHEQRQIGKKINFSILYGLTPYGLSKDLGISQKEAKAYIESYFAQYPGVLAWMETVIDEVMAHGYVQTLWGRRRYIPTIFEKNRTIHEQAKRMAVNTKVQGTAADIMKLGMVQCAQEIKQKGFEASMVLQIHDEILVTTSESDLMRVQELIKKNLESVVMWDVPLQVTTRVGDNWRQVTK